MSPADFIPVFKVRLRTLTGAVRYNGPRYPLLRYDVLVVLKTKTKVLTERCHDACSIPEIGRLIGFRKLFGRVTEVIHHVGGLIEVRLEHPKTDSK